MRAIADDLGVAVEDVPEVALRYILSEPAVSTVIPGMRSLRNVERNIAAGDGRGLPAEQVGEAQAAPLDPQLVPVIAGSGPPYCAAMRRLLPLTLLLTLALPAAASAQNPWLEKRVLNIAHQGGEDEFPSNTLYAFKKSVKAGRRHARARRRRDEGRQDRRLARHDARPDDERSAGRSSRGRSKQIRELDAAYWFAKGGDDAYAHDKPRKAYRFRGDRDGRAQAAEGLQAPRLPRADAAARS